MNSLESRSSGLNSVSSSLNSMGETLKKTAINIAIGTAIIAGGVWAICNVPGIIPTPTN